MTERAPKRRLATVLLSVGVAAAIEITITLEWASPSCSRAYQAWNGPVSPAFGMPLPYLRPSLVTSVEYLVMPHIYLANLAILALIAYPVVSAIIRRFRIARGAVWLGLSLCMSVAAWRIVLLSLSIWFPQVTIAFAEGYSEFRPVGIATRPHLQCRASEFWFPERQ